MRVLRPEYLLAALLLGCAPAYGAAFEGAPAAQDADEQLYLQRIQNLPGGTSGATGLPVYDTLEPVPGVRRYRRLPLAASGRESVGAAALAEAARYAEAQNSSALIIWQDGKIQLERYFGGATADTPLLSRSLAKPLSAIAVGRAIRLGFIRSLDQPVADFITEWKTDPRRSRILMRHLLDMRSGLLRQSMATGPDDILNRAYLHPRHDEVLIREYPAPDEPGSVYEYSQATSDLVAIVIERATGRRYADFIGREVWAPLGARGGEVWVNRPGGMAHSGCCMFAPADSWLRLGILVLQQGRWNGRQLLPVDYTREMTTPTPQNEYFGMATFVAGPYTQRRGYANPRTVARLPPGVLHAEPYESADLVLFDGSMNQVVYMVPSERLVILRMALATPRAAGTPEWDNSYLPNLTLRALKRAPGTAPRIAQPRAPTSGGSNAP
jgi:CubicO group peptidase (beta-lactamase class C family)